MEVKIPIGLVLMRGNIETLVMSTQEAQYLTNMWQLFLLDDDKYKLMEIFNYKPQQFDFQRVVDVVKQAASEQHIYKGENSPKEESK